MQPSSLVSLDFSVRPDEVHEVLARHILADGLALVYDHSKSHGVRLVDALSGKTYLDLFGFFASSPLGSNHPGLTDPDFLAKIGQIAIHNPSNSDMYTVEMAEFVETFARFAVPPALPHLFFVAGGALGVENALKTAMDWKVRKNMAKGLPRAMGRRVVHFENSFHGRSGYTLSLTNTADPRKYAYFAKFDWPRVSAPRVRFPLAGANLEAALEAEARATAELEAAFDRHGDDICAIVIEPIQGEGGDNHFRPEFHATLRRLADEREAFLIYDEVQTGFGTTGKLWAFEHYDVVPDAVAFGKKTQVCGIMVSRRVEENERNVFAESARLNSTWGGNLVDMVRCTRHMRIMHEERLVENAAVMGARLLRGLERLRRRYPEHVLNPRGRGLFCAFDLPSAKERDELLKRVNGYGVLVLGCDVAAIRFRPPLVINAAEVDEGLAIFDRALEEMFG